MHSQALLAFKNEMKKIASSEPSSEIQKGIRADRATLATFGAGLGATGATYALMKNDAQPSTIAAMTEHVQKILSEMKGPSDLEVKVTSGWDPKFDPGSGSKKGFSIELPLKSRDAVIAHEIGHAKSDAAIASLGMSRAHNTLQAISRFGSLVSLIPTIDAAARSDEMSYTPGVIQAILSSPMMVDEIAASSRATAHLIRKHGVGKGLVESLPLVPALATYTAIAGAPLLITYLRRRAAKKEIDGLEKVSGKKSSDSEGLNFFERHPKKIIGGSLAALGTGAYLLSKRKKGLSIPKAPSLPSKSPQVKALPSNTPQVKVPARKLTPNEIAEIRKKSPKEYPGYGPVTSTHKNEKHINEAQIQAAREEGIRVGMPTDKHRALTTLREVRDWLKKNKSP